jgi:hypothetical protein
MSPAISGDPSRFRNPMESIYIYVTEGTYTIQLKRRFVLRQVFDSVASFKPANHQVGK